MAFLMDERSNGGHETAIATITDGLLERADGDALADCGLAVQSIIANRPDEVLDLAYQKLSTWPFASVPLCWRRLYEDASLYKAKRLLRNLSDRHNGNVLKLHESNDQALEAQLQELVCVLDRAIIISGAPRRSRLIQHVFKLLGNQARPSVLHDISMPFPVTARDKLLTSYSILRAEHTLSFEDFQKHLDQSAVPLIVPAVVEHWPAYTLWKYPQYLLDLTLQGRRLVPVEIGRSYTDDEWAQRLMPFQQFLNEHVLPPNPATIGYLAQHDLFEQFPELRSDISTPDYCFTSPTLEASATQLDEPLTNAWFGPKGTRTPLHTDPYHNILCQVFGYKYVRLYAPAETPRIYAQGTDENGINMENTTKIDVRYMSFEKSPALCAEMLEKYPSMKDATYQEAILGPGECLYIPLGWWHYIESVSISFSVSFWWN